MAGCDTAGDAACAGPGALHAYWGGLYVDSAACHRLRTGPFTASTPCDARFSGPGAVDRLRWASLDLGWTPEYRFTGRILVHGISPDRPHPYTGLVLHPVHVDNCNNYYVRLWRRDDPTKVDVKRELADVSETYLRVSRPGDIPPPSLGTWHTYRIDVLAGSRIRFHWDGAFVCEASDPDRSFSHGPVGMRLDDFDAVLDDTRVSGVAPASRARS